MFCALIYELQCMKSIMYFTLQINQGVVNLLNIQMRINLSNKYLKFNRKKSEKSRKFLRAAVAFVHEFQEDCVHFSLFSLSLSLSLSPSLSLSLHPLFLSIYLPHLFEYPIYPIIPTFFTLSS